MCNVKQKVDTGLSTAGFPDPSAVMSVDDNHSLAPREHGCDPCRYLARGVDALVPFSSFVFPADLCNALGCAVRDPQSTALGPRNLSA